ncbi:MAG: hypothetical protein V4717_16015 [Bacteroidota bacterium]
MNRFLLSLAFVLFTGIIYAQTQDRGWSSGCYYIEGNQGDSLCENERSYLIDPNVEASKVLLDILSVVGLRPSFKLQECNGINNCVATIGTDHIRYIIYDKNFIQKLGDTSKRKWIYISIFAHEVLHHLNSHTFSNRSNNDVTRREQELEADKWSGTVCAALGATLQEAQYTMQAIPHPADSNANHPAKAARLAAIEEGYNNGIYRKPIPKAIFTTVDDISMRRNGFRVVGNIDSLNSFHNKNEIIQRIVFLNNSWYVFFTIDSSRPYRNFSYSSTDPFQMIYEMKQENKRIKSIDYLGDKWIITFEENLSGKNQFVKSFNRFDDRVADSLLKQGLLIDELTFGQGKWLLVLDSAKPRNAIDQLVTIEPGYPLEDTKNLLNKPHFYEISMVKYVQNKWITILHKYEKPERNTSFYQSRYSRFRIEKMIEGDIKNYHITQAGFDGRNWVFVMKKTQITHTPDPTLKNYENDEISESQ